jgi:hypothetical protein
MDVARTEGTDQNLIANKLTQTIFSANSGPTNVSSAFGAFPKLPFCRSAREPKFRRIETKN